MVSSAGAMFSTPIYQSQTASKPSSKKGIDTSEGQEPGKKPKKVNSEIRKQQNRIASRNYREKRKRKLQYLQKLLQDGDSPEQTAQAMEDTHQERMATPEYHAQRPPAPAFTLPSNASFQPLAATSGNAIDPTFATSATSYDGQLVRTPQSYATYENSWSPPMYNPSSNVNLPTWTVPAWIPDVDYTQPASSRPDEFQYTTPPHTHPTFAQLPTPPQQTRTPDPDLYVLGSYSQCRRVDSQQPIGISNMSLPSSASSSPFPYTRYAGVP